MADPKEIQPIVERVLGEVLKTHATSLREEVVQRVLKSMSSPQQPSNSETLNGAMAAVQQAHTQVEILDCLIRGVSLFSGRCAIWVLRANNAIGWRAHGLDDNDAIRTVPVSLGTGLAGRAIQSRSPVFGDAAEFDLNFATRFGSPEDDKALVVPLIVRDKPVALIYADSQGNSFMDRAAIEALVRTTGLWLEITAARKAAPAAEASQTETSEAPSALPEASAEKPSTMRASDTFQPQQSSDGGNQAPAAAPLSEEEVHKKARRFAKLLVDEIKLYNQGRVNEGRQNRDLYDRLKDDIEKSRASYDRRYGNTSAATGNYFNEELVRILADNDPSLLGNSFPR
ncbi:MAG TPA: GAF domain-containing protein [Terriglobales bacterium]|nr:GAF domain-containing protein [Terriglobales bacterium]